MSERTLRQRAATRVDAYKLRYPDPETDSLKRLQLRIAALELNKEKQEECNVKFLRRMAKEMQRRIKLRREREIKFEMIEMIVRSSMKK